MKSLSELGVIVPKVLIPSKDVVHEKWPVIACDQYTSNQEYWDKVTQFVGKSESTLNLIYPEIYLEKPDFKERVKKIQYTMNKYSAEQVLEEKIGMVLVERNMAHGGKRIGLMIAVDLENYDYLPGARSLIRPTEDTIVSRLPVRVEVRSGASLELPHILMLVDDPKKSVIEPIYFARDKLEVIYDVDLPMDAGHIKGYLLPAPYTEHLTTTLNAILDQNTNKEFPLLFAVGDGNHSLASAKAYWNQIKKYCEKDHPARYALVELINLHDTALEVEPIHRVVFHADKKAFLDELDSFVKAKNSIATVLPKTTEVKANCNLFQLVFGEEEFSVQVEPALPGLDTGIIQDCIDSFLRKNPKSTVDYIHGEAEVMALAKKGNNLGVILPPVDKHKLLPYVEKSGPLPRKFFSLGEADEKRFYFEARRIK